MKKYFPYIIVLICLSLIGLIYLQVQWIDNATAVQKTKYENEISNSLHGIRQDLIYRVAALRGYNPKMVDINNSVNFDYLSGRVETLTKEDFQEVIASQLKQNNIDLPFEYGLVKTIFNQQFIVSQSNNFDITRKCPYIFIERNGTSTLLIQINEPDNYILKRTSWMITSSVILSVMIFSAFLIILYIIYKQKKVGEVKSDFINNMTHEFKTPLATISLAVDALNSPKILEQPDKIKYFASIIKDENQRMNKQVQKILEAAKMEKDNLELNLQPIHIHEYIKQAAQGTEMSLLQKGGHIELFLNAKNDLVEGDEVHISNILFNLLDNAVKYCDKTPLIQIYTTSNRSNLIIKIEDNGIGMKKEVLSQIFEKFYRVHTGNVHNVKGFGLGLSYVKTVVQAHKGKIKAESSLGNGSTFIIELPILRNN